MRAPTADKVAQWTKRMEPSFSRFAGKSLTRDDVADMVRVLFHALPGDKPTDEMTSAAMVSLKPLIGNTLSASAVKRNFQRMAANWQFIRDGMAVPFWDGKPTETEVGFLGIVKEASNTERFVVMLKLKTGLCAGIIQCALFYRTRILAFLQHDAGVSKFNCGPEEISGMQCHAVVSMAPDRLEVETMTCTAKDKDHNKELSEARRSVTRCEIAPLPCNVCMKDIKECPLAIWLPAPKEAT